MLAFSSRCPVCGTAHDYQSSVTGDDAVPEDGDLTLCISCGSMLYFDMEIEGCLRVPTASEQAAIDADPNLQMVKSMWAQMIGGKRP
jgi:sugar (pentulose or hexulose) kinase